MSSEPNEPLVMVLTPVYNGEKYLRECLDSVLAQSYRNWRHVIINNCSKDATPRIAAEYAARDPRIRLHHNTDFVGVIQNHNIAVRLMDPAAKYCKIVQADDLVFPNCLREMVQVAEAHPSVGVVASYRLCGERVDHDGLPYPSPVVAGREICRRFFQQDLYLFGAPTATMIRADLVRKREPFYNEENLHADTEACLQVLQESDLGFVHQVLTYTRLHAGTVSSRTARPLTTSYLGHFECLVKCGRASLSEAEYAAEVARWKRFFYRGMAREVRRGNLKALRYNAAGMRRLGHRLSWLRLGATTVWSAAEELVPGVARLTKPVYGGAGGH